MVSALLASILVFGQQSDASKMASFDDVRRHLDSLRPKHFRGVVYVEQAGEERFFHAVGFADPATMRPITKKTGFCIGSIVKPMVRVASFRLIDQGRLSLEDPISKFFAGVPEDKKGITVRHLSEHTSGFRDVFGGDYQPMGRDELMEKMLASELLFRPGERNQYSNSGFTMLATILEKVSGKSIEDLIAEVEFKPIGLERVGYVRPGWKKEELAVGYSMGQRWGTPLDHFWEQDGPSWNLRGNGGMLSTVTELARWARAVNEYEVIRKENHAIMVPGLHSADAGRRFWISAGGNGIFNTVVAYNPGKRLVIVAASLDSRFEIESERELMRAIYRLVPERS